MRRFFNPAFQTQKNRCIPKLWLHSHGGCGVVSTSQQKPRGLIKSYNCDHSAAPVPRRSVVIPICAQRLAENKTPPVRDDHQDGFIRHPFRVCFVRPAPPVSAHPSFRLPCRNDTQCLDSQAEGNWVKASPCPTWDTLILLWRFKHRLILAGTGLPIRQPQQLRG